MRYITRNKNELSRGCFIILHLYSLSCLCKPWILRLRYHIGTLRKVNSVFLCLIHVSTKNCILQTNFSKISSCFNPKLSELSHFQQRVNGYARFECEPDRFTLTSLYAIQTVRSDSITDGRIKDGRWAEIPVESGVYYDEGEIDANMYGTLRGPWNFNPSPYITRFPLANLSLPTCSQYKTWLSYTTLQDFLYIADGPPHTGTHDSIGGVYGCDSFDSLVEKGWLQNSDMICFKVR